MRSDDSHPFFCIKARSQVLQLSAYILFSVVRVVIKFSTLQAFNRSFPSTFRRFQVSILPQTSLTSNPQNKTKLSSLFLVVNSFIPVVLRIVILWMVIPPIIRFAAIILKGFLQMFRLQL